MSTPAQGASAHPAGSSAGEALQAALAVAGPATGAPTGATPRLIRHGSHAVYAVGALIARVGPHDDRAAAAARQSLAVARWLHDADFPAARAVADGDLRRPQPIAVHGHLVTFWHSLGDRPTHGSTGDLGRLLRRFHALVLPAALRPAPMDPVGRITRQLAGADRLDDGDRAALITRLADVAARYAALPPLLPAGHLHGDATVANIVLDGAGRPTLIDLDLLRTGPREWDLLRTAVYAHRLGWHTADEHTDLCAAYGVDVAARPGFDVLADLTELLQVAWLADAATRRPQLAGELATRITSLRTGGSRRSWRQL